MNGHHFGSRAAANSHFPYIFLFRLDKKITGNCEKKKCLIFQKLNQSYKPAHSFSPWPHKNYYFKAGLKRITSAVAAVEMKTIGKVPSMTLKTGDVFSYLSQYCSNWEKNS